MSTILFKNGNVGFNFVLSLLIQSGFSMFFLHVGKFLRPRLITYHNITHDITVIGLPIFRRRKYKQNDLSENQVSSRPIFIELEAGGPESELSAALVTGL